MSPDPRVSFLPLPGAQAHPAGTAHETRPGIGSGPDEPPPRADPLPLGDPLLGGDPLPLGDPLPFRASNADETRCLLEQGLVRRVIADVLVAIDAPNSRAVRARAIALLIPDPARPSGSGWVTGFSSAAWLHTGFAGSGRRAPEELHVIIPPGRRRPRADGVRGRQVALRPEQVMFLDGVPVTNPVRTAADVARDLPADAALAALRQLGELSGVRPHQVITMLSGMRYARGAANARRLVNDWAEER